MQSGSLVVSDGLACFSAVKKAGCLHNSVVTGGGHQRVTKEEFTWVNTMIGNVKNAITGTYHAINPHHLPRYLAEFCYRFTGGFIWKTCCHDLHMLRHELHQCQTGC